MIEQFRERILDKKPLRLRGGGSKDFYGQERRGDILDTRGHAGILDYEPTELVITAKCGTPLAEIKSALAERRQMLAFEPPAFGDATIGGVVAAGLSGPRRAAVGAVRDFVLGVKILDGEGRLLTFGGQVMKNVAGYDVSRLMCGSLGTLGLITEVSLKVLPLPVAEATLRFDCPQGRALELMNGWAGKPLPVSATCWHDDALTVRLSGARAAVDAAASNLGGEKVGAAEAASFWDDLREQRHAFFSGDAALWRLSVPSVAPALDLPGATLIEWGGAQRWVRCVEGSCDARAAAASAGGHATQFRGGDRSVGIFQPLDPVLGRIHRDLKRAFDPHGVFNPGRLYPDV
ncbi:glycolate oxidase subunit GlcE [Sulfurisoma sediminicola]|uniref:Glycolate oxidase FAD binding subunit n=1 Tax=Sulfurisoma sediminicola TaxID=1381557 RepID=A0A497XJR3_9PROT|nr:glycolate oxidase subunit GlcE [Sulfurisoma sediminicola]RLJ67627.1 glycolate oxidase FAD binding subunit [Sulfurisoma sediminicola]